MHWRTFFLNVFIFNFGQRPFKFSDSTCNCRYIYVTTAYLGFPPFKQSFSAARYKAEIVWFTVALTRQAALSEQRRLSVLVYSTLNRCVFSAKSLAACRKKKPAELGGFRCMYTYNTFILKQCGHIYAYTNTVSTFR